MVIRLNDLLARIPADTRERVDRTRKRVNQNIREALRRETGLLLNRKSQDEDERKQDAVTVPVALVAGLPANLKHVTFEDSFELILLVSPFRRFLEQAKFALSGVAPLIEQLGKTSSGQSLLQSRAPSVQATAGLIAELLALVNHEDPVKRVLAVDDDILGTYNYKVPDRRLFLSDPFDGRIELYWGVIGLVAEMLGIGVEPLTTVVLTHELAHAYTHVGSDIDGERWASLGFSQSDRTLKEGLAQYYTELTCRRLDNLVPETMAAYNELLKRQPPAYHTHEVWTSNYRPEEIRLAMLAIRRSGVGQLGKFSEELEGARQRLRRE